MTRWLTAALALGVAASLAAQQAPPASMAAYWSQWRGTRRDGLLTGSLTEQWPARLTKHWEVVVGTGYSSPVISRNRVVVMARQGDREVVRALDLGSGKELWKSDDQATYTVNPSAASHGPGPKSTPVIAGGGNQVITFGIAGVLTAFDLATGKLIWKTPAPAVLLDYGTAMSPVVDGAVVVAHMGGKNDGAITAFNTATGAVKWKWTGELNHARRAG